MKKKNDDNITQYPNSIDTRVALLEMSVSHIYEALNRLEGRLEKMDEKMDSKFFWLLSLLGTVVIGLAGLIARAAHWI